MPHSQIHNLFESVPDGHGGELLTVLAENKNAKIERIVSHGHASPDGFWYDQAQHEWVVVLRGEALLRLENEVEPVRMKPGDFIHILPHVKHRVDWTTPDEPTIWLAIFYNESL